MGPGIHDRAHPAKDMQSDNFLTMSALTDSRVKVKGCDQRRVVLTGHSQCGTVPHEELRYYVIHLRTKFRIPK
jgi:hypothetical protein